MKHKTKGQSTIEYILLVAAVIVALLVVFRRESFLESKINGVFKSNVDSMIDVENRIFQF